MEKLKREKETGIIELPKTERKITKEMEMFKKCREEAKQKLEEEGMKNITEIDIKLKATEIYSKKMGEQDREKELKRKEKIKNRSTKLLKKKTTERSKNTKTESKKNTITISMTEDNSKATTLPNSKSSTRSSTPKGRGY